MNPVRPTRLQLISGRARFAALALSLLAACTDSPVEPTVEATPAFGPDLALVDGSTGGNPDFWWLPPTIPLWDHPYANPDFERDRFDPDLRPFVDICEDLDRNDVCDGAATSVEADVQPWLRAYSARYRTSRRDRNKIFLATARVDDIELGQVHVVVKLSNYQEGDAFVIPGLWAIFRFSIEEDALCIENNDDFQQGTEECTSESLGGDGGEVVLEVDGTPTLSVQIPATGTPTTITVSNECVDEWPLALPELSDCFHVDESAGIEFDPGDPAVVCLLVGTGGEPNFHDEITLYQFTSEFVEALPRVDCPEVVGASGTGGPLGSLGRLARGIGSFIGPEPLHAAARRRLHFGGGGSVLTFKSDFLFSVPLAIERFGFDQFQEAPVGTTLDASVRVYFEEVVEEAVVQVPYDGTEFPIALSFEVTDGGGNVDPTSAVVDDPTGIASTAWTLGGTPGTNTMVATAGDGFGNSHSEGSGGPFYSDDGPTEIIFGEGSVTFEAEGVEEEGAEPITIDGVKESAWDDALSFSVFADPDLEGSTLYVLNDLTHLYIGLYVTDGLTSNDIFEARFDDDNDEDDTPGDDNRFLNGAGSFTDAHFDIAWGITDTEQNGEGAVGGDEGTSFYEVAVPLNSGDANDLALVELPDTIGLCIRFFKDGTAGSTTTTFPPNCFQVVNDQVLYQDVQVLDPE